MLVAAPGQQRFDRRLHRRSRVIVRQLRREAVEIRVGFQRQVVGREMRRREADGRFDICARLRQCLLRQAVHQIEVEIIEVRMRDFDRAPGLCIIVNAAERFEMRGIETLDADREAVDPGRPELPEFLRLERARIGFERDLSPGVERQPRAHRRQNGVDALCRKQARRAAAEKHAVDFASPHQRQRLLEVGDQRRNILLLGKRPPPLVRIEIAIRALAHAPRDMDVESERRQRAKRDASRYRPQRAAVFRARCLSTRLIGSMHAFFPHCPVAPRAILIEDRRRPDLRAQFRLAVCVAR